MSTYVVSCVANLTTQSAAVTYYGAPAQVWLQVDGAAGSTQLNFTFTLVNKTATRLVEAHWVVFNPAVENLENWTIDKVRLAVVGAAREAVVAKHGQLNSSISPL